MTISKKSKNEKLQKVFSGVGVVYFIFCSILFIAIAFTGVGWLFDEIFSFLGGSSVTGPLWLVFAGFVATIFAKIYDSKLRWMKKVNWYLIFSFYLLLFIVLFSVGIAGSLVDDNRQIIRADFYLEDDSEDEIKGILNCFSNKFVESVKNDVLSCHVRLFEVSARENFSNISITKKIPDFGENKNYENQFSMVKSISKYGIYEFNMELPDENFIQIDIEFLIGNSTYFTQDEIQLYLEEKSVASSRFESNRQNVYSILSLIISVSIFTVFAGMNNLRQLYQNK